MLSVRVRTSPAARSNATHASRVIMVNRSRRSRSACRTSRITDATCGIVAPMMPAPAVMSATYSGTSTMCKLLRDITDYAKIPSRKGISMKRIIVDRYRQRTSNRPPGVAVVTGVAVVKGVRFSRADIPPGRTRIGLTRAVADVGGNGDLRAQLRVRHRRAERDRDRQHARPHVQ